MAGRVCVGAIAGAFGVRGEVRVKSFTAEPDDIGAYGPVETEDGTSRFSVTITGHAKKALVARLSGIDTKEQAEALRGTRLYVDRALLPEPDEDEFYHADLIGMEVYDTGGAYLGSVKTVLNHGASDLLEIRAPGHSTTVLLPFTQDDVPTVDLAAGRIVADPPEGLF